MASDVSVDADAYLRVTSGGSATSTTVLSGGIIEVDSGGYTSVTIVSSGGHFAAMSGSITSDTDLEGDTAWQITKLVLSGIVDVAEIALIVVTVGTDVSADTKVASGVDKAGQQIATNGVTQPGQTAAIQTLGDNGFNQALQDPGNGVNIVVQDIDGNNVTLPIGNNSQALITQSFASVVLEGSQPNVNITGQNVLVQNANMNGGQIESSIVVEDKSQVANINASDSQLIVGNGSQLNNARLTNTNVSLLGGSADSMVAVDGSTIVNDGGTDSNTELQAGASETIVNSGTSISNRALKNALIAVKGAGLLLEGKITGGVLEMLGGIAGVGIGGQGGTNVAISISGAVTAGGLIRAYGANISNTVVHDDKSLVVGVGGSAVSSYIYSAAEQDILSGETAFYTTLGAAGSQVVSSGGVASSSVVSGGYEVVLSGGAVIQSIVSAGGFELVSAGGVASGLSVSDGGSAIVGPGGLATGAMVTSGGVVVVSTGGITVGTAVSGGGTQVVSLGGVSSDTVVSNGGTEVISLDGVSSDTTISSGGTEVVSLGGLASDPMVVSGGVLIDDGTVIFTPTDNAVLAGVLSGNGTIEMNGTGKLVVAGDSPNFTGVIQANSGTLELTNADAAGGATILFPQAVDPTLVIDGTVMPTNIVSGMTEGDTIDLPDVLLGASNATLTDDKAGDWTLTVGTASYALYLAGNLNIHLAEDAGGGAMLVTAAPCFAAGTRIRTEHGDVAVEDLLVGDVVATLAGGPQPIRWIGHRKIDCRRHPRPEQVWPIHIAADAFARGVPSRDLFLSPDHAIFVDKLLIPVKHLVNDRTIALHRVDTVTYYHIELPRHDVVLAEALAVETFLDTGNRGALGSDGNVICLHSDFFPHGDAVLLQWEAEGYAPLLITGPVVDAAQRRLCGAPED